ncbi:hypothetical protein B0J15DRAFT_267524 [Fusarium solani]|uniref:Secreted protein n=1 Tax=Fusarium solani TaxID=169388 RepID=A0A9P9HVV3_FUSSL|nr:uncharacterized protein B0J15DRAFT_267524 [Fusarium solani]KAH7264272.1 hypothetical protein B0J15DRAFT_267524 [Fusarium solani]
MVNGLMFFFFFSLSMRPALFSFPPTCIFLSSLPFFAPSPVQLSFSKPSLGFFQKCTSCRFAGIGLSGAVPARWG